MRAQGRKSHYYKFFFSFILILIIPVLTIVLIFFRAKNIVEEQIVTANRSTLEQFFRHVDNVMDSAVDTALSIAFGEQYRNISRKFLIYPNRHAYYAWMLDKELDSYRNEKFQDVFVYYPENGYVISAVWNCALLEAYYDFYYAETGVFLEEFERVAQSPYKKPTLYSINGKNEESFQCIALRVGNPANADKDYVVVVVLNREYMRGLLQELEDNNESGISFILNANQEVIYSTGDNNAQQAVDIYEETEEIYECIIGEESYVMLSRPSQQLDAFYAYGVPNRYFWSKLYGIYVIFFWGIMASAVLGVVMAKWQTRKAYQPIKQMMFELQKQTNTEWDSKSNTEFEFIETLFDRETEEKLILNTALRDGNEMKKRNFIFSLLNGTVKTSPMSDDIFVENGFVLCSDYFCVAILQSESKVKAEDDLEAFVIGNVMEELLEGKLLGRVVPLTADRYVMLFNLKTPEEYREIKALVQEASLFLNKAFQIQLTVGMSSVQEGLQGIQDVYEEANKALQYSYLLGKAIIIEYAHIADREFRYPNNSQIQMQRMVIDYLEQKSCGEAQARKLVEECMTEYEINQNASLEMMECFKFETIAVFNRVMQQKECWTKEWKEKVMELVSCSTLCEFKEQFANLLVDFAKKQKSRVEEEGICARAKEYIDDHYNDSQLSVTVLGSMLEITPYYLSTMFRNKYQLTIPDYIAKARVNHAKILLRNSSDNILKIARDSGFQESTSFIRVFKKLEGMTPGAYRNFWLDKTTDR